MKVQGSGLKRFRVGDGCEKRRKSSALFLFEGKNGGEFEIF
jgi:hypothetical protein